MNTITRVLIVDDSAFVRKTLREMIEVSPHIEVVGAARDGLEALEKVAELQPDVITLDLIMPHLDGVGFLEQLMAWRPTPTIVVSITGEDAEQAIAALAAGAVDIVQKPTALASDRLREVGAELIEKIRGASGARPLRRSSESTIEPAAGPVSTSRFQSLVIGCSTGGPQALRELVPRLPADLPVGIGIVLHMPVGYTQLYAERLNTLCALEVKEAAEGDLVEPGRALLAPAGRHMVFAREGERVVVRLESKPFDLPHRPSVDVLFASAARVYGDGTLGVILTGMGSDGTQGGREIRAAGGVILAEAEESCVVYGMPRSAVEAGVVNRLFPLNRMPEAILSTLAGEGADAD